MIESCHPLDDSFFDVQKIPFLYEKEIGKHKIVIRKTIFCGEK